MTTTDKIKFWLKQRVSKLKLWLNGLIVLSPKSGNIFPNQFTKVHGVVETIGKVFTVPVLDDHELSDVEENTVDLNEQGHDTVTLVVVRADRQREAANHL